MFKAILYKEWIKIRWAVIGIAAIILTLALYNSSVISYYTEFQGAFKNWMYVIGKGLLLRVFSLVKYIPIVTALAFALLQFVPEMAKNRMRLSYHLPVSEKKLLFGMTGIGLLFILAEYAIMFLAMWITSASYYPAEVTSAMLFTTVPWMLGGIGLYYLTAMIILEPSWLYRIIFAVVTLGIVSLFFEAGDYNQFEISWWKYMILVAFTPLTILFPGYRFRHGSK